MPSSGKLVPQNSWDTHLHILDPQSFPYKSSKTYTPESASLQELLEYCPATNFLLVQASVENGRSSILHYLQTARRKYPHRQFRAEIEIDQDEKITDDTLKSMSVWGVRAMRLHGIVGVSLSNADSIAYIKGEFVRLGRIAQKTGWYISAMCHLSAWLSLGDWLLSAPEMNTVKVIIEHNAFVDPEKSIDKYPDLESLIGLLRRGKDKIYLKLCGINRLDNCERSDGKMPSIPSAISVIAESCPESIMWGSDWPHVRYKLGNSNGRPVAGKKVDINHELSLLKKSVSNQAWEKMMVENPSKLLG